MNPNLDSIAARLEAAFGNGDAAFEAAITEVKTLPAAQVIELATRFTAPARSKKQAIEKLAKRHRWDTFDKNRRAAVHKAG